MVALPLVDSVFSKASPSERSRAIISQFVKAAITELEEIESLEDGLAPEDPLQFDRRTATLIQDEYERWASDAELLLQRIDHFEASGSVLPDSESLRHAYGKTRARLSTSIDDMEESLRDLAEGRLISGEEVRRGLL